MNPNQGGTASTQQLAAHPRDHGSTWSVILMALAIIGVMYVYDRAVAQETPPSQKVEMSCHPVAPGPVTDADTFKPRS